VCAFLGERFDPAMVRMEDVQRYRELRDASGSAITTAYVGRYRDRVPACDLAFIQRIAGRQMEAFGYDLDAIRLTPRERMRSVSVTWPINLTRLGTLRVAGALRLGSNAPRDHLVARR
jgi:hypothetical protein